VATCPNYLDYELAVLKSNIAACYLKLDEWKEAVKSASEAVSSLDRLEIQAQEKEKVKPKTKDEEEADVEEEIVSSGAARAAPPLPEEESPAEVAARQRAEDIKRIRAKALMRRAKARGELGGWSNLAGAEEDYKTLSAMTNLGAADRRLVQAQLRILPPKVKAAQEKETQEMWGKLKDVSCASVPAVVSWLLIRRPQLGNGILKPFGLSTDNFQMAKDDKTGGYSMSFKSNEGKK